MLYKMPHSRFRMHKNEKWVNTKRCRDLISSWDKNGRKGYFISCDIKFPAKLSQKLDDYPPAPVTLDINESHLSKSSTQRLAELGLKNYSSKKLVGVLSERKNYFSHIAALQCYLNLGATLEKVHYVCSFRQVSYLKRFVRITALLRKNSKNSFYENLWKRVSNSLYGKLIENVFSYRKTQLVDAEDEVAKYVGMKQFQSCTKISKKIYAIHSRPKKLFLNKLYAAGFTILEVSKVLMFNLYYNIIKPACPGSNLIYSDTDSLILSTPFKPETFFDRIGHIVDYSNYPTTHKKYSQENKNALNFVKDECKGTHWISEWAALRPKNYSIKLKPFQKSGRQYEKIRCKGVSLNKLVDQSLSFKDYVRVLKTNITIEKQQVKIVSKNHQLTTCTQRKRCLNSLETKRFWKDCGIHSLAHGNKYRYREENCLKCALNPLL